MKDLLKMAGSLLMDQLVGIIAGFMLVLCVSALFHNSLGGYLLAFLICFGFYAYATYHSAFKCGFHNNHRATKDRRYKGYLYNGAAAGALSALPLLALYIAYRITRAGIMALYFMIANMYWTWPLCNALPNHVPAVMLFAFAPIVLIPWLGYIAGYKDFHFTDMLLKLYRKFVPEK